MFTTSTEERERYYSTITIVARGAAEIPIKELMRPIPPPLPTYHLSSQDQQWYAIN
jgi:hypothetical protein